VFENAPATAELWARVAVPQVHAQTAVPEPMTLVLFGAGLIGVTMRTRR
jgi:hypothetical protein